MYGILPLAIFTLIGWFIIIILRAISRRDEFSANEIGKDQNNLFGTGLVYIIVTAICMHISNSIIVIIASIALILFALLPTLSSIALVFSHTSTAAGKLSALIPSVIPLIIGVNLLYYALQL